MAFDELIALIEQAEGEEFFKATREISEYIFATDDFLDLISQVGAIPEKIDHDSTGEKLFAKASDTILCRAFREIGLESQVSTKRADSADVIAKSPIFGYSLVADAKSFRLSRTAKNQKDFKISSLSEWRDDHDYAVLCAPYFQYPRSHSQIYGQALDNNVCLLSWEHLIFLLSNQIEENKSLSFSNLWNFADTFAEKTSVAEKKNNFIGEFDISLLSCVNRTNPEFENLLNDCKNSIILRGETEKNYWENERKIISTYTYEELVNQLIKSKKIDEKIEHIDSYLKGFQRA
jgi:type II restriction enzyme